MTKNQICLKHLFEDRDPKVFKQDLNVIEFPTGEFTTIF